MFDYRVTTFLTVAETKNFTKAAQKLHITQPAVSTHIHQLEKEYNTKFFVQVGKQIQLTENGRTFFHVAMRMKNDDQHMRQSFLSDKEIIELNFGTTLSITDFCLQESIKRLWEIYPKIHLRLSVQNTESLLEKINQGCLDFAIVEGYHSKELYDSIPFQTQEYIPVCNPNHKFLRPISSLQDLRQEPLLIREEGSGTRETLERILSVHGLTLLDFQIKGEIGSLHVIKQCVLSDVAISFFYQSVVEKELREKSLKRIHIQEKFYHTFSLVWSKKSIFAEKYKEIGKILAN